MNEATADIPDKPEQPQDNQDDYNRPKHVISPRIVDRSMSGGG
jgi:hypothetical protein